MGRGNIRSALSALETLDALGDRADHQLSSPADHDLPHTRAAVSDCGRAGLRQVATPVRAGTVDLQRAGPEHRRRESSHR